MLPKPCQQEVLKVLACADAGRELDSDLATALHIQIQGWHVGEGKAPRPVSLVVERKCSYRQISSSHWPFNIQCPGKGPSWLVQAAESRQRPQQRGNEMPALLLNNATDQFPDQAKIREGHG